MSTKDYAIHVMDGQSISRLYVRADSDAAAIDRAGDLLERDNAKTAVVFECDGWAENRCIAVVDVEHGVYVELDAEVVA